MVKESPAKALVIKDPALSLPMSLALIFTQSGMFKDVKTQAEAVVKILAGKELGLPPIQSMNEVFIVNGKTSVTAKVIASLVIKSGRYDYLIDKLDDTECALTFRKKMDDGTWIILGKSIFTFKDAAKAGLVNKDVWKNYPRNMLYARALTNGQRWYAPDIFQGYSHEELESIPEDATETTLLFDQEGNQITGEEEVCGKASI